MRSNFLIERTNCCVVVKLTILEYLNVFIVRNHSSLCIQLWMTSFETKLP